MEKLQTLVIILLGLGIFVWRMLKQAAETTAREQQERPRRPGSETAPALPDTSFQELLRQMQNKNQPQPTAMPEPVAPVRPAAARSLERRKKQAVSLEEPATTRAAYTPEPHARRAATLPRAATVAPMDDYWAKKKPLVSGPSTPANSRSIVLEALHNPATVRAAFVLSEILRRPE